MAYCIFAEGGNTIIDWGVMNLLSDKVPEYTCNCALKTAKKRASEPISTIHPRLCLRLAKYQKGQEYFCEKHAKASNYSFPNSELSKSKLQKCCDFGELSKNMNRSMEYSDFAKVKRTKKETIEFFMNLVNVHCLESIVYKKTSSKTANLVDIGKEINVQLSAILLKFDPNREITHIIIENQISPIANRMKTIQGMLSQYFIMKYEDRNITIDFISSFNKLKMFSKDQHQEQSTNMNPIVQTATNRVEEPINANYKKHKKDGIYYCRQILEQNLELNCVVDFEKHAKKDDLADSFLQGIWYLKSKNIITIADNLKINSVTQL